MNKTMVSTACLLTALACSNVQALEFPVTGTDATGLPGQTVFVVLDYDYGASFAAIVEDLQFEYQFAGITFDAADSTIGAPGAPQALPEYINALRTFAQAHEGSVLVNPSVVGSQPDYTGWAMSFYTADGTAHSRSGPVQLRVAFDIPLAAQPGVYKVNFTDRNVIVDADGNEYGYPDALRHLTVTVVPEPAIAWLLLPGLALVGLSARRRVGRCG